MNIIRDIFRTVTQRQSSSNSGVVTARDRFGIVVGRFDPNSNRTTDRHGRVIGHGNLLASLV